MHSLVVMVVHASSVLVAALRRRGWPFYTLSLSAGHAGHSYIVDLTCSQQLSVSSDEDDEEK